MSWPIKNKVILVDTLGELKQLYLLGDIAFVGGSLVNSGGQNILEPILANKPVVFGPSMFNFSDAAKLALKTQSGLMVNNPEELFQGLKRLLTNRVLLAEMGQRSDMVLKDNQGATQKHLETIRSLIT